MKSHTLFITGASRGIGRAIALRFADDGWNVAITASKDAEGLADTKSEIEKRHVKCLSFLNDASDSTKTKQAISETLAAFGFIDLLVNNAGIASYGLFTDLTSAEYERILAVNLTSVLHACHAVVPSMVSAHEGRIINISSIWGVSGASCEAVYSASKAGVNGFTQALAKELAPSGIAVNAVACGVIDTEMNRAHLTDEELTELEDTIPIGRMASPDEVAEFIRQLSQTPTYLTGQIIPFDGGYL